TSVVTSAEARLGRIQGLYEQFLHRAGEAAGVNFWAARLAAGVPIEQVVAGLVGSDEYRLMLQTPAAPTSVPAAPGNVPTVARPALTPTFGLAPGTADLGPDATSAARVTLVGRTAPGATLTLAGTGKTALASGTGAFQIPGVSLAAGDNTLTVRASL